MKKTKAYESEGDLFIVTLEENGTVTIAQPEDDGRCHGQCCGGLDITLSADMIAFIKGVTE